MAERVADLAATQLAAATLFREDLRHTAASWMRMHGADIHTVALILGHKDLRMAARYQHLSPAFLSDAVRLLDSAFAEHVSASASKESAGETSETAPERSSSGPIVTAALPSKIAEEEICI